MAAPLQLHMGRAIERMAVAPTTGEPVLTRASSEAMTGFEGMVLLPLRCRPGAGRTVGTIPDGNRGAILTEPIIDWAGRDWLLGFKGVGARRPMFSSVPWEEPDETSAPFTSESYFGENPWGSVSRRTCLDDTSITDLAYPYSIKGFQICPVIRAEPLPDDIMTSAMAEYSYRKQDGDGPFFQEMRLMPSNVRLFYQSGTTLGKDTKRVLKHFDVGSREDLDDFIINYVRTGMAALTLSCRTARKEGGGISGLDYHDVWLDKDSVISPQGELFFADIEGLDWAYPVPDERFVVSMAAQFNRNFYEFMYVLDRLIKERELTSGSPVSNQGRRETAASLFEVSLAEDRYLDLERRNGMLMMTLVPDLDRCGTEIRLIDLGGRQ